MTELVGDPKVDSTHYGDRPDNKNTPPADVDNKEEHTAGSEHHPARHGRGVKAQIDHAIRLEDKIEELKHDISKENVKGNVEEAKELDRDLNNIMSERAELSVAI